jgi:hypothetical protein
MSAYDPAEPNNPARRKALSCLAAWSGAAVVWTVADTGVVHVRKQ